MSKNMPRVWLLIGSPALCLFTLAVLVPVVVRLRQEISGQATELRPPDLSGCTRIELRNESSLAEYPFNDSEKAAFLTPDETRYLRSLKSIVVEDREGILTLAHEVTSATYEGWRPTPTNAAGAMRVVGTCESDRVVSFVIWGPHIETEDGHLFYNPHLGSVLWRLRPEIWPFQWRKDCANKLQALRMRLNDVARARRSCPSPSQWCDAVDHDMRRRGLPEDTIKGVFVCPSVREGKCCYAMNPASRPDSPPDMVLLFETRAGWNQHGGPELFTFDNHDPKGGCVLLNDGTVKFIRTEEELKQLRWK